MKRLIIAVLLGLLAAALLVSIGLGAVTWRLANICDTVVHHRVLSPAGTREAVVFGSDCGAVATITSTTVAVGPPGVDDPRGDERMEPVFRARVDEESPLREGSHGPEVAVRWVNDSSAVLRHHPAVSVRWAVIRSGSLSIGYDTLP